RTLERDGVRVQEHPVEAVRLELGVPVRIPILLVAGDWIACISCMHTNLMRSPGLDRYRHERRQCLEVLERRKRADSLLAFRMDLHDSLAAAPHVRLERQVDRLRSERPAPDEKRKVCLLHLALPQERVQLAQ